MNFLNAFQDGAGIFFIVNLFGLVLHLINKHDTGEFDYKDYSKFSFYGFFLFIATFLASLLQLGDYAKK